VGLFSVAEDVRDTAPQPVKTIITLGVKRIVMLSGHSHDTARAVAKATGVAGSGLINIAPRRVRFIEL